MDVEKIERLLIQNIAKAQALEHVLMAVVAVLTPEQRRTLTRLVRKAAEEVAKDEDKQGQTAQAAFDETYASFFRMLEE